jgi:glycosyltransferase involved in cell wall biosynthesis
LETAKAAVQAGTPLWVIGKPYSESDDYAQAFFTFVQKNPEILRYEGPVHDRQRLARIYREARGFVLLSTMESLSLSALEAAACECPLLLSDLPWAHTTFGDAAWYCPVKSSVEKAERVFRVFYEAAPAIRPPPKPQSWIEVAGQLKKVYQRMLDPRE